MSLNEEAKPGDVFYHDRDLIAAFAVDGAERFESVSDDVPVTLGQESATYLAKVAEAQKNFLEAAEKAQAEAKAAAEAAEAEKAAAEKAETNKKASKS